MNILIYEYKHYCVEDIEIAFRDKGHNTERFTEPVNDNRNDAEFEKKLESRILEGLRVCNVNKSRNDANELKLDGVRLTNEPEKDSEKEPEIITNLIKIDALFSFNYYPVISKVCKKLNIKYISWVYDSPLISLYSYTIINECNYVFIFDYGTYAELKNKGINTVYYLPLAVSTRRMDNMLCSCDDKISELMRVKHSCDVSFVGSLYSEKKQALYSRLYERLDEYTKGYLDSIIHTQYNMYGCDIMEKAISDEKIMQRLQKSLYITTNPDGVETPAYTYANYFLARRVTELERKHVTQALDERFDFHLYTHRENVVTGERDGSEKDSAEKDSTENHGKCHDDEYCNCNCNINSDAETNICRDGNDSVGKEKATGACKYNYKKNMGPVDYYNEMPYVFNNSKINLNITLRSIKTGIPLRIFDIMGAGGLVLTNYQQEMNEYFVDGVDYVLYSDVEEVPALVEYLLEHEDERKQIALNGYQKVKEKHSFEVRVEEIMGIISE